MKKTFPVNINSKIYYIDEDAYKLLDDYLTQLRATFSGNEGEEIVYDIEQRISEHFDARAAGKENVIVKEEVSRVIEIMGKPEMLGGEEDRESAAERNEACPPPIYGQTSASYAAVPPPIHHRLYRDERHKVFGGVIAGLAQYLGWDATIMRVFLVLLAFFTHFWPCIIAYLIAWMVIPVARTPRQILEMQGQAITLGNIGQTVIYNAGQPASTVPGSNRSGFTDFINTFFSIVAKVIIGGVGVGLFAIAMALICCIVYLLVGLGAYSLFSFSAIIDNLGLMQSVTPTVFGWFMMLLFAAISLPAVLGAWYCFTVIFKIRAPKGRTLITMLIVEIIFIVGASILGSLADHAETTAKLLTDSVSVGSPLFAGATAMTVIFPSFAA